MVKKSLHYICPVHGDIGAVSVGCGAESYSKLADIVHIRAGGSGIDFCAKCYLEYWKNVLPSLTTKECV